MLFTLASQGILLNRFRIIKTSHDGVNPQPSHVCAERLPMDSIAPPGGKQTSDKRLIRRAADWIRQCAVAVTYSIHPVLRDQCEPAGSFLWGCARLAVEFFLVRLGLCFCGSGHALRPSFQPHPGAKNDGKTPKKRGKVNGMLLFTALRGPIRPAPYVPRFGKYAQGAFDGSQIRKICAHFDLRDLDRGHQTPGLLSAPPTASQGEALKGWGGGVLNCHQENELASPGPACPVKIPSLETGPDARRFVESQASGRGTPVAKPGATGGGPGT
ncbi:hypothetical protein AAFF_G00147060 [Aldrovandia affinis]|uniref:Uncharacterized protein n=1 Tax=Aldrovandia affinis TaxID=143900 RepID=A0AAD7RPL7_9TELE|nr:hypothetical protein AAFF_G00147060 [Aldrovandia affinis]